MKVNLGHDATLGGAFRDWDLFQGRGLEDGIVLGVVKGAIARLFVGDLDTHCEALGGTRQRQSSSSAKANGDDGRRDGGKEERARQAASETRGRDGRSSY